MNTIQSPLSQIVSATSILEKNSYSVICSPELKFKFIGKQFCDFLCIKEQDVLNKDLSQLNTSLSHLNKTYRQISEKVLLDKKNKSQEYITVVPVNQELEVFHSKVNPIIFEQAKIGLYIKTTKVNAIEMLSLLKRLNSITNNKARVILINQAVHKVQLTDREEFILFMIALGKYDKEIAYFLSLINGIELTRDAITKIVVRNLYQKFDATTRSELVIHAHNEGFLEKLPKLLTMESSLKIAKFL